MSSTAELAKPMSKRAQVKASRLSPSQLAENSRRNGALGGRPKGAVEAKTRRRVNEILSQNGETPVDVMFDNMLYWHRKVRELEPEFMGMLAQSKEAVSQLQAIARAGGDGEDYTEALRLMRETNALATKFLYAREKSQSCAVDAAPYCHPRLQAIAIQSKNTHEFKITGGLPDMPVAEGEAVLEVKKA